jgi:hypothetical protein
MNKKKSNRMVLFPVGASTNVKALVIGGRGGISGAFLSLLRRNYINENGDSPRGELRRVKTID